MKLRKIKITNVRSFRTETEFLLDGEISIIVGPNGGGKTNLLDTIVTVVKRYLMPPWVAKHQGGSDTRLTFMHAQNLGALLLEKHTQATDEPQIIVVEVEITQQDISNICSIKTELESIETWTEKKYLRTTSSFIKNWNPEALTPGRIVTYAIVEGHPQILTQKQIELS
jgi:AAA15 family ATPase/GTPase